jgi:hypothetical protein
MGNDIVSDCRTSFYFSPMRPPPLKFLGRVGNNFGVIDICQKRTIEVHSREGSIDMRLPARKRREEAIWHTDCCPYRIPSPSQQQFFSHA